MRIPKSLVILSLCMSVSFGAAAAQAADIEGLTIRAGDTVDQVKQAYNTQKEPEPYKSTTEEGSTSLQLKTKGVWFFFNKDSKIYTIRLDAPFPGTINGVKIGDTTEKMIQVLGQPVKTMKMGSRPQAYIYYLDDDTTANFSVDSDGNIETVFLGK